MQNSVAARVPGDRRRRATTRDARRSRGQILVLFVIALFVFTGMVALVIDVSWYWVSSLRIQRAADAAALAGAVQLPTNPTGPSGAYALALAEARKNGFATTDPAVTITPVQEPAQTGRRLAVTITAPVNTFFMRLLGINQIMSTRVAKAEYVLPVPMGSPENYYGVFGEVRGLTSTSTEVRDVITHPAGDSGWTVPGSALGTSADAWVSTSGTLAHAVADNDSVYAQADADGDNQQWSNFDLLDGLVAATDRAGDVNGIEVELNDTYVTSACSDVGIAVALSYDGGTHWTTATANNRVPASGSLGTSAATDYALGDASNLNAWPLASPSHTWTGNDLGNSNFRLRLTANQDCGAGPLVRVDQIRVRARFDVVRTTPTVTTVTTTLPDANLQGPGSACASGVPGCFQASGDALNPRGFWGTMNTEGAENINGDAYQPYYDDRTVRSTPIRTTTPTTTTTTRSRCRRARAAAPSTSSTQCSARQSVNKGTGDRWFSGAGDPVSTFFELYDTKGTLYDRNDDGDPIASSGDLFRGIDASDTTMGGSTSGTPSECRHATDRSTATAATTTTSGTCSRAD